MNPALLRKRVPELTELSPKRQEQLFREARELAYGPDRKLEHWRRNLFSLAVICAVSLFLVLVVGPTLGIPNPWMGGIIMVLVLPAFIVWRQRQDMAILEPEIRRLVARESISSEKS